MKADIAELYRSKINGKWFAAGLEGNGIIATAFADSQEDALRRLLACLPYNIKFRLEGQANKLSRQVLTSLWKVYRGECGVKDFKLKTDHLPTYVREVLDIVRLIPTGYVTTYKDLAEVANGNPRLVGRALSLNPFILLIPCHRVVRSNFSLGGYSYGVEVKREILQRESRSFKRPSIIPMGGKGLPLYPVELVKAYK